MSTCKHMLITGLLALAAVAPAHASITYTVTPTNGGDPGYGTIIDNFAGIRAPETSYWLNGGLHTCNAITGDTSSCNSSVGNPPLVNGSPDTARPGGSTGAFLSVNPGPNPSQYGVGFFQIGLGGLTDNNVSFNWGSVDQWNFAQLLDAQGQALFTLTGTDLGATFANGTPFSPGSERVTFSWSNSDPVATLQFGDTFGPAMEVSDVSSLGANTVPEPGSMALLAAGLGVLGLTYAQRRAV